jgi:hypothetical protein
MKKEFFFAPASWDIATYIHGFCWDFAYQNFSLKILATEIPGGSPDVFAVDRPAVGSFSLRHTLRVRRICTSS